ncbi:DUF2690 domain-containing protein [Streptomyces broussonetiae]|uniref:DUF2690 domain-containing protein n=1 Tax=Streptomyces broussonetiae TaxID=2686304 RepID=A0ABV5EDR0_9ACTN
MSAAHPRLTAALRELKDRTGLSLAALAERTAYSKSSWERYLNGKAMPPRQAVQALCRIAREPEGRLLALWDIAESQWSGRAADPRPAPPSGPEPGQPPPRPRTGAERLRGRALLVVLASVYAVIAGAVALTLPTLDRTAAADQPRPAASGYVLAPRCHGAACEGRDPMRMVCAVDADTLTTYRTTTGAHVELRYSAGCGASWARMWGTRIGDRTHITVGGPPREARTVDEVDAQTYVYTLMATARPGSVVHSCFRPAAADAERECVDARVGAAAAGTRR